MVDRSGRLADFGVKPGNAVEDAALHELVYDVATGEVIADKAYDTNFTRQLLAERHIITTIPPNSNRKIQYEYDKES